jgi:hypothetical protein
MMLITSTVAHFIADGVVALPQASALLAVFFS